MVKKYETPMLDQLKGGKWPSFIDGILRLAEEHPDERIRAMNHSLLGQLEHSYETRKGYWKGGTVSVFGYGGGIIPRFSEVGDAFPASREFHTLRVQPPAGNFYSSDMLRQLADSWEKFGSGLVTFHGQTGNIMFIGTTTDNTQHFFDENLFSTQTLARVREETTETDGTNQWLEFGVKARWDLPALVFNPSQLDVASLVGLQDGILKEVTGLYYARRRLQVSLLLTPPETVADRIYEAIVMPDAEKERRMRRMRETVRRNDIYWWLEQFLRGMSAASGRSQPAFLNE